MLRAHSFLWYYLWVAPYVFALSLAFLLWRRGMHRRYPFFVAFLASSAIMQLTLFVADISPAISGPTWWKIFWADLIVQGILKFALIGEIFSYALSSYSSVAKLSRFMIRGVGVALILTAALAAAFAPASSLFGIISGAHILEQTIYLIETGLLAFIFLFSAYFRLTLARPVLGISLGLGISACVHLATWALLANGGLPESKKILLDFVNMGTYHACVLIWFYYLLVPHKASAKSLVPLPENNLAVWNRELERLLQP
jgi:hypothetical protein